MNFLQTLLTGRGMMSRALLLGLIGGVMMGSSVVFTTIAATDLNSSGGDEQIALGVNSFVNDTDLTMARLGIFITDSTTSAAGDSAPGVEASSALPAINNALTVDNYAYRFTVKETNSTTWQSGEDYKIRVFAYDSDSASSSLLATLYFQQAAVDDANVEGITATIDLGLQTGIYDHFDIIAERQ